VTYENTGPIDRAGHRVADRALVMRALCRSAEALSLPRVPASVEELLAMLPDLSADEEVGVEPHQLRALLHEDLAPLSGSMRELMADRDVAAVRLLVNDEIAAGRASDALATAWHRHLLAERYGVPLKGEQSGRRVRWKVSPPEAIKEFLARIDVEFVPHLGPAICAAAFVGPRRTRIVLAADAVQDAAEAEFEIFQLGIAAFNSDLSPRAGALGGFGCWIDYRRDHPAADGRCGLQQHATDERSRDFAVCLMDEEYISHDRDAIRQMSRSLLRGAVQRSIDGNAVLRAILGNRLMLRSPLTSMLGLLGRSFAGPRLQFTEHMLLVRDERRDDVYLLWADPSGIRRRRWIPSRRVLAKIGVTRIGVIPPVTAAFLAEYQYDGVLVSSLHVDVVRDLLRSATSHVLPWIPGRRAHRLRGVAKARSVLTLDGADARLELVDEHHLPGNEAQVEDGGEPI
jgi:hypothetical protein